MKKILFMLFLFMICFNAKALNIQSNNAILYLPKEDKVLYEKNSDQKEEIASLTKIMTGILFIEDNPDMNKEYLIKSNDISGLLEENLVTCNFKVGEKVTGDDLLHCLLLVSGADSAKTISNLSDNFVDKMNEKAKSLGMNNTSYSNPIGLDDKNNYSTASDLLKLFKYALKNKTFYDTLTTSSYTTSNGMHTFKSSVKDKLILGGKTGTTDGAGLCLASLAKDKDEYLYLITLGAPYDKKGRHNIEDAKKIYTYYINNYDDVDLIKKGDTILKLKTKYSNKDYIYFKSNKTITRYLDKFDKSNLQYNYNGIKVVSPFSKKDLGSISIKYKGEVIYKEDIVRPKIKFSLIKFIEVNYLYFIIVILLGGLLIYGKKHKNA